MTEGCFAVDTERSDYQLHLSLGEGTLEGLVDELAGAALACLAGSGSTDAATAAPAAAPTGQAGDGATVQAVRDAIAERLRARVVAYDLCGLFSQCRLSDRFNPWARG